MAVALQEWAEWIINCIVSSCIPQSSDKNSNPLHHYVVGFLLLFFSSHRKAFGILNFEATQYRKVYLYSVSACLWNML